MGAPDFAPCDIRHGSYISHWRCLVRSWAIGKTTTRFHGLMNRPANASTHRSSRPNPERRLVGSGKLRHEHPIGLPGPRWAASTGKPCCWLLLRSLEL